MNDPTTLARYAAKSQQTLAQGIILHGYNIFGAALVASVHGPRWAVPQIVLGVLAVLIGGSK
jgi:hypothetical protein